MRKSGKYVKQAVKPAVEKKPSVKSALMQTYFTSLLCLVLCVSMFLGTSYAWFTSEVVNRANEIYVGTLAVDLYKEVADADNDGKPDRASLSEVVDNKNTYHLFDGGIRWEPGYTALETIQIVNQGDLAFKYVMTFTDGTLADANGASLSDVAKYFDVWVFDHLDKTYEKPASYAAITTNANWVNVGTLAEVLDGKTVLSGNMGTVRKEGQNAAAINEGTTDGVSTVDRFTIALHMNEMANSEVMGHKISLNVKLVAYQLTSETDAFGNATYDDGIVTAADVKELKEVLTSEKNVVLASDIEITNSGECVTMSAEMLDGNGKAITYSGGQNANGNSVGVVTTSGGKVSNLTIDGKNNGRALYVTKLASDLVVSDCTLSGAYSFNLNSATKNDNALISFIDTRFTSWTSYANVANHVYFTSCTFNDVLKPYGDTTLTNCTFTTAGLDVSKLEAGEVITLINCTYNGKLIEKAVLTSNGGVVTISESDAIKVDDGMVILKGNG